jgi:hypothetical protein
LIKIVDHGPLIPFDWECPFPPDCFQIDVTGVEEPDQPMPDPGGAQYLHPVTPNPSSGQTTIAFDLSEGGAVSLKVYDVLGRAVKTLVDGNLEGEQRYQFVWDGTNDEGRTVDGGVYFIKLRTDGPELARKVLLLPR